MSFHSDLTADAVLPEDIRTALSLSDSASVYTGRARRAIKQQTEVWIERLPSNDDVARGLGHELKEHRYRLHVLNRNLRGDDGSGDAQLSTVEGHMRTLARRYHGARPFSGSLSDLVSVKAQEGTVDVDPDQVGVLEGTVDLTFYER